MYSTSLIDKRKKLGWSCKKLAEIANVPLSAILRMEKGIDFWEDYATKLARTMDRYIDEPNLAKSHIKYKGWRKWSLKYDKCVRCGTVSRKHVARGLCIRCYRIDTEEKHKKHIRKRGVASKTLTKEFLVEEYVGKRKSLSLL